MIKTRMCVVCRKKGLKGDFIRIVKNKSGEIKVDTEQALFGRSAYVCKNETCLNKLVEKKLLNRAFKMNIDNIIYNELRGENIGRE